MPWVGKAMDRRRSRRISEELAKTAELPAESVQCRRCGALAGVSCKSPLGLYVRTHKIRRQWALELTQCITTGRAVTRSGVTNHAQPCTCDHCTGKTLRDFNT